MRLLVVFLFFINFTFSQSSLVKIKPPESNPGNLELFLHIPSNLKDAGVKPLVIALHGCTETASGLANISDWNKLADKYGFYVLYPQQKITNNVSECFNWFREKDVAKDRGEVASIKEMIDYVIENHKIDTTQLFVYGLSAGAAMGVALLTDYPSMFNAGAILAGGAYTSKHNSVRGIFSMINPKNESSSTLADFVKEQNPTYLGDYPRMIIVHGKDDQIVDIQNSYQLIQQWTYLHQTDTIADSIQRSFQNHKDITKYCYEDNSKKTVVTYYEIANLGHALMVDPGNGVEQGGNTGMYAVDKDFFSTYWIARDFGIIEE